METQVQTTEMKTESQQALLEQAQRMLEKAKHKTKTKAKAQSNATASPLSDDERKELASLEQTIESGLKTAFEVGAAISRINTGRLYREQYKTFEEYVAARWNISRQYAYQYMDAAKVRDHLAGTFSILPANEFQARPLKALEPEQQTLAWQAVLDRCGNKPITNKVIQAVVADLTAVASTEDDLEQSRLPQSQQYLLGNPLELLTTVPAHSCDLLLINELTGSTPQKSAERLAELLKAAMPAMKEDHNLLVFTTLVDTRQLLATAESLGYECGVSISWINDAERKPIPWSALVTGQTILHLRRGKAAMVNPIANAIECAEETFKKHSSQKPLALIKTLIGSVTKPGDMILDPVAGAATANIAADELGRGCIGTEFNAQIYADGLRRLAEFGVMEQKTEGTSDVAQA